MAAVIYLSVMGIGLVFFLGYFFGYRRAAGESVEDNAYWRKSLHNARLRKQIKDAKDQMK